MKLLESSNVHVYLDVVRKFLELNSLYVESATAIIKRCPTTPKCSEPGWLQL